MAAKLVLGKGKFDNPIACLKELHWLPVTLTIDKNQNINLGMEMPQ